VGPDDVQIAMDRGDNMSTLEIDVQIPNGGHLIAA
jgi:septum formation topological specificity factor MinE